MTPYIDDTILQAEDSQFALDVWAGLTKPGQKQLPPKYFYDALGSRLFEAITALPEYGVTRAEERLLANHADNIASLLEDVVSVAELGCGSGKKTRRILQAIARDQATTYYPIEISPEALAACEREVSAVPGVRILGVEAEYLEGLRTVVQNRPYAGSLLVLFLGSTLGNFDTPAAMSFLRDLRGLLRCGDFLLLGTDLEKPVSQLVRAYNDPLGVTRAFNLNILVRINRELCANFDLARFEHVARFNRETHSVEMHLQATESQTVNIARLGLDVRLGEGETIWTESSHKYSTGEVFRLAEDNGFRCEQQWVDEEWPFAETLLVAA